MKIKVTAHIHYRKYSWEEKGEFQIIYARLNDDENCTYIGQQEVEIEVPDDFDPRPAQIQALVQKRQSLMAETKTRVQIINDRISNLQALEYTA
jgi:hypothetical protein